MYPPGVCYSAAILIPPPRIQGDSLVSHTVPTTSVSARRYSVAGMTCEHCVLSVTEEVSEIAGVTGVAVDLAAGQLTVTGADFTDEAVAAAVADAGYEVVA